MACLEVVLDQVLYREKQLLIASSSAPTLTTIQDLRKTHLSSTTDLEALFTTRVIVASFPLAFKVTRTCALSKSSVVLMQTRSRPASQNTRNTSALEYSPFYATKSN